MKIWEPKSPGTLWATPGMLQDSFTYYIIQIKFFIILRTTVYVFACEHYGIGQDLKKQCYLNYTLHTM